MTSLAPSPGPGGPPSPAPYTLPLGCDAAPPCLATPSPVPAPSSSMEALADLINSFGGGAEVSPSPLTETDTDFWTRFSAQFASQPSSVPAPNTSILQLNYAETNETGTDSPAAAADPQPSAPRKRTRSVHVVYVAGSTSPTDHFSLEQLIRTSEANGKLRQQQETTQAPAPSPSPSLAPSSKKKKKVTFKLDDPKKK